MEGSGLDGVFSNFAIPYERFEYRPFTDTEDNDLRLVGQLLETGSSADCYPTPGGSLSSRPAFNTNYLGTSNKHLNGYRIDNTWQYLTLPDSAGVVYSYLLMSAFRLSTAQWEIFYLPLFGGTTAITACTNTRSINNSLAPHKIGFSRGLAYIKAAPSAASGEKLGTVIFDGSGGSVVYRLWGLLGPTVPARMSGHTTKLTAADTATSTTITVASTTGFTTPTGTIQIDTDLITYTGTTATTFTGCTHGTSSTQAAAHSLNTRVIQRDWSTSAHKVEVNTGWLYAYTWKTAQGQESNRSNIEFNPDLMPSDTLPFFGLRPKMIVQGNADTTNITKICIYRTTDGGGDFYFLEELTNSASGDITYEDDSLGTGASSTTFEDPVPDAKLDTTRVAPSLTSNSPPPTVNPPLVVGTDTPSINASPIAVYSSRFWYALANMVYFSGDEEIKTGIPEESFPSGVAGNFFRFADRIVSLQSTSSALYILGSRYTYILTGTSKDTFNVRTIASHAGMSEATPFASVSFLDRVAWLSVDGRVFVASGDYVDLISEPIIEITRSTSVQFAFFTTTNNQWLCILTTINTQTTSFLHIYDWTRSVTERRDFWYPPWSGKMQSIFTFESTVERKLGVAVYDSFATAESSGIVVMAFGSTGAIGGTDSVRNVQTWDSIIFTMAARILPFKNPPGNHVNTHAIPQLTTVLEYCKLDFESLGDGGNIGLKVFYDNASLDGGTDVSANQTNPTRRSNSVIYRTKEWRFWKATNEVAFKISNGNISGGTPLLIHRITVGFAPGAGPDSSVAGGDNSAS